MDTQLRLHLVSDGRRQLVLLPPANQLTNQPSFVHESHGTQGCATSGEQPSKRPNKLEQMKDGDQLD